ncbi:MAG TPA: tonB-system energizer ExbB [Pseudomonas sp.]|uniref:tonB-system energizer ExbB n=1 Tax=Pseudomonas sp. TaxID=306 RepID=UPI002C75C52E|nr:tonB-system energizer ExbB [Pseudomonas sp.]HTO17882.1 tonB-system energizer ExbB [Pseudomonas sp.]
MNRTAPRAQSLFAALLIGCLLAPIVQAQTPASTTPVEQAVAAPAPEAPANAGVPQSPAAPSAAIPADAPVASEAMPPQPVEVEHGLSHDLSPWGMYQAADWVVKAVMIGLVLASVLTWTIALAKGLELGRAKRRLGDELVGLKASRNLKQAAEQPRVEGSLTGRLVEEARHELELSGKADKEGIKERVSFRFDRMVGAAGRQMSQGTGVLASVGSVSPFVGLFGTVWGIMNSFIGIAKSQTTNLAVVAPGIAEALLATAIGLVAAIPAVVLYNIFARAITGYRAQVGDAAAEVLLLVSRDLDHQASGERQVPHVVKVG